MQSDDHAGQDRGLLRPSLPARDFLTTPSLHLDSGAEMRGGQWQVLYLLEGLRGAGHDAVLLARRGSPLEERARAEGLDVRPLSIGALAALSRRACLVHAHDARSHTLAALFGRAPLVVARRVAFDVRPGALSRWKYRRPRRFIAVSEYVRRKLLAAGIDDNRIDIVYDGVPLPHTTVRGDAVLAPATLDPMKGSALLREAARLAGVSVRFSTNLKRDLQEARLFVYITHAEGLGSGALLAMAAGVPVIASRAGGLPEVVEHERTGLLTENSPEAIAGAIGSLLADRNLADRLALAARRRVEQCFSVDRMIGLTLDVYRRALA